MLLSSTPLRMSFVGGGSDLPSFYLEEQGCVLSTTIDQYVHICINKKFDDAIRVSYSETENVSTAEMLKHPIVREVLEILQVLDAVHGGPVLEQQSEAGLVLLRDEVLLGRLIVGRARGGRPKGRAKA